MHPLPFTEKGIDPYSTLIWKDYVLNTEFSSLRILHFILFI